MSEEAVEESPSRKASPRATAPLGTIPAALVLSAQGEVLEVEEAFLGFVGGAGGDVRGKPVFAWLHAEDRERTQEILAAVVEERREAQLAVRLQRADGDWCWVELHIGFAAEADEEAGARLRVAARDISDRVAIEQELEAQRDAERRISEITRAFLLLRNEEIDGALRTALEHVSGLANAGRVQLVSLTGAAPTRYRWDAPGVPPRTWDVDDLGERDYRWAVEHLLSGRIIHVPDVADLPPEARAEREGLQANGVQSYLMIPIFAGKRMLGSLDFHRIDRARAWSDVEIARLEFVAELFASVLQRKHAEEALRVSEDRLRAIAENARDILCESDRNGRLLYLSPSAERLLGYRPQELLDKGSLAQIMNPDHIAAVVQAWRDSRTGGAGASTVAFQVRRADESWCWMEANGSRYRDRDGQLRDVTVLRDVSEREHSRQALDRRLEIEKQIAQLSRHFLDVASDEVEQGVCDQLGMLGELAEVDHVCMAWMDDAAPDGYWLYEPSARSTGEQTPLRHLLSSPELTWTLAEGEPGRAIAIDSGAAPRVGGETLAAELERAGVRAFLGVPVRAQGRLSGLVAATVSHGERHWQEETVSLVRLVAEILGSALRRRSVERALQESQVQLLQAQKMEAVGTLAGGIAHDFNNHLAVMLGNTRFVRRELRGEDPDIQEALEDLQRSAEHCAQLTGSLLAFSRRGPSVAREVAVGPVLAEVRELVKPMLPSSIALRTECEPGLEPIEADVVQLQQVLVNLLVNARDAMPDGGEILLSASNRVLDPERACELGLEEGSHLEITVRDDGLGMDPEVVPRIFEPFFTTKELGKGTGLGLAMVYGITQDWGGGIEVESERGVGSTFRILLPELADAMEQPEAQAFVGAEGGHETVLLVEDEPAVRRLVSRMLASQGYRVIEASNGREALDLEAAFPGTVDLVVTDLVMPELGGVELAHALVERQRGIAILFLSGHSQPSPSLGEQLPRAEILQKPFEEASLFAKVRALLGDTR